ncbi:hypothetical protein M426DRAFT_321053 [Hypoxylon sp. CI-4A]|nr:hypothetical protein M426DRAFT_321053 [Hypoxylon sp. CI-4A]
MSFRGVVADSDDEDGDDTPLSPPREDDPLHPDVEPLSPPRKPSSPHTKDTHNHQSGSTDQSFFASVYDEQQNRALERSQLIENIVRQSQRASGSSGEIPLPAKGKSKGKRPDASSATDVTSPMVINNKPKNRSSLLSDGATNITTPRKSAPTEWDVPSSPNVPRSAKSSRSKKEKSYGKRSKDKSRVIGSSAAAEIFMGDDGAHRVATQDLATHDEIPVVDDGPELPPYPATKRRKVSLPDSAIQETPALANFYIAQSNLTTMQKLEYQKTNAGYSSIPGTLPNPKSSGTATVAYSTPSRYASSSGPPLPWEREPITDIQPDRSGIIDIASSPDIFTVGHDNAGAMATGILHPHAHLVREEAEISARDLIAKTPLSRKRKKGPRNTQDEDELAQDELFDTRVVSGHSGSHKRQRQQEYNPDLASVQGDDDVELIPNPQETVPPQNTNNEPPQIEARGEDEKTLEMPSTEPPIPVNAPEPKELEVQPTPQPKKRGRKKKQVATEQTTHSEQIIERDQVPTPKEPDIEIEPEKPKKKRGRPKKSDPAKSEAAVAPEPESLSVRNDQNTDVQNDELALEKPKAKSKSKKKQGKKKEEKEMADNIATNEHGDEDASPLREIDSNSRTPSQSKEDVSVDAVARSSATRNVTPKSQGKGDSTPKPTPVPTPSASQPKVPYRVGLSKRTRITSLLKSIKR